MTHTIELEGAPTIEAPRKHSLETQERLRHLLLSGAQASPDPKRAGFFEIEDQEQVFYIHVVRRSGRVTLLAVWGRAGDREPVPAEALA